MMMKEQGQQWIEVDRGEAGSRCDKELDFVHMLSFLFGFSFGTSFLFRGIFRV